MKSYSQTPIQLKTYGCLKRPWIGQRNAKIITQSTCIYDNSLGYMAGVISKRSNVQFHNRDFEIHNEDNYHPVIWFWDRDEQAILVERKPSVFSSATDAARAL